MSTLFVVKQRSWLNACIHFERKKKNWLVSQRHLPKYSWINIWEEPQFLGCQFQAFYSLSSVHNSHRGCWTNKKRVVCGLVAAIIANTRDDAVCCASRAHSTHHQMLINCKSLQQTQPSKQSDTHRSPSLPLSSLSFSTSAIAHQVHPIHTKIFLTTSFSGWNKTMMPRKMAHRKKTEKGGWKYSSKPMMLFCRE